MQILWLVRWRNATWYTILIFIAFTSYKRQLLLIIVMRDASEH